MEKYPGVGVYSKSDLNSAIAAGRIIKNEGFLDKHVGPASIDLTVADSKDIYRVERLIKPSEQKQERVLEILPQMGPTRIQIGDVLYPNHEYLMRSTVSVNFSPGMYGYANAKSTSGRNFVLVRTIVDHHGWFDTVDKRNKGFTGDIWISIKPLSHGIILTQDECYNQLRVFDGDTRLNEQGLRQALAGEDLLFKRDKTPYKQGDLNLFTNDGTVICTLYAPAKKLVGYKMRRSTKILDLTSRNIDPTDYVEPIYAEEGIKGDPDSGQVFIRGGDMLLLSTGPMIKIPVHLSSELRMLDPRLGLFFSHFAGYFDPGFFGTATLEVIALHDMTLRHGDPIARFELEHMRSETESYAKVGTYGGQIETQLPKQFAPWE
jgi:deoxycytidine triphosphate deaminase